MSGTMRKMGVYLGLLEDAEHDYAQDESVYETPAQRPVAEPARGWWITSGT